MLFIHHAGHGGGWVPSSIQATKPQAGAIGLLPGICEKPRTIPRVKPPWGPQCSIRTLPAASTSRQIPPKPVDSPSGPTCAFTSGATAFQAYCPICIEIEQLLRKGLNGMNELDRQEREVLDAFENGRLVRSGNFDQIRKEAQIAASNTLRKTKRINLRISERDLDLARIRALEEGLPYQTMLSSVIHKFLAGRLIERRDR